MEDINKTKNNLIEDLAELRQLVSRIETLRSAEADALEAERKLAEEALKESDEKFRAITGGSQIGVCIVQDNKYIYMNEKAEEIGGYTRRELNKWRLKDYLNIIHPDDRDILKQYLENDFLLGSRLITYRIKSGSGRTRWMEHYSSVINYSGRPAVLMVIEDVTSRKEAEAALKISEEKLTITIYSALVLLFILRYKDGRFIDINDTFEYYTGFTRGEVKGNTPAELGIISAADYRKFTSLLERDGTVSNEQFTIYLKSGERAYVLLSAHRMDIGGESCIAVSGSDITARKWAEAFMLLQHELGIALGAVRSVKDAASLVLDAAVRIEGVDCGSICLRDTAAVDFMEVTSRKISSDFMNLNSLDSRARSSILKGMPYYSAPGDFESSGPGSEGLLSTGSIPFFHKGEVLGCMNVASRTLAEFPIASRRALETVAGQVAGAISRLQAEEALRRSEEIWRSLVENAPNFITIVGRDGTIKFINHKIQNLSQEKVAGRRAFDFVQPGHEAMYRNALEDVFSNGGSGSFEINTVTPDGGIYIFDNFYGPVKKDGAVTDMMLISIDITRRKKAEQALMESEKKYRSILEKIEDVYYRTDMDGNLLFTSESGKKIFGYNYEKEKINITREIYRDDAERENFLKTLFSDGSVKNFVINLKRKDGTDLIGETNSHIVYDENGTPVAVEGIVRDISERVKAAEELGKSEAKFRSYIENAYDIVYTLDHTGRFSYISPNWTEIFLYNPGDVVGTNPIDYLHPDDITRSREFFRRVLKTGERQGNFEYRSRDKYGRWRWYLSNVSPIKDENGRVVSLLGISHDITESKELVDRLEEKTRELESFVYTVSHDLKAPLVSLEGFSSLLEKEYGDRLQGNGVHYIERIKHNVDHMEQLIRDLLDLSRIGRITGETAAVDLGPLLDDIVDNFKIWLNDKKIKLSIYNPLPRPYGDRGRIKQVFENLISNAVKFTGDKPDPHIEIGAISGLEGGDFYGFYVRDNGIGIDKKYFGNIFQIFCRLGDIEADGTGVGLTIVKKIIDNHGGKIWIDSAPGRGSTFYFTLPSGSS